MSASSLLFYRCLNTLPAFQDLPKKWRIEVTMMANQVWQLRRFNHEEQKMKFTHQDFSDIRKSLLIQVRTAEWYIARFCEKGLVFRDQKNSYAKRTIRNPQTRNPETAISLFSPLADLFLQKYRPMEKITKLRFTGYGFAGSRRVRPVCLPLYENV